MCKGVHPASKYVFLRFTHLLACLGATSVWQVANPSWTIRCISTASLFSIIEINPSSCLR